MIDDKNFPDLNNKMIITNISETFRNIWPQ